MTATSCIISFSDNRDQRDGQRAKCSTPALIKFAGQFSGAQAIQLVRELRREESRPPVSILKGANWLTGLAA